MRCGEVVNLESLINFISQVRILSVATKNPKGAVPKGEVFKT